MAYHPYHLDDLMAPGWTLKSGYAIGPWADFKDMMVRAAEWETLVWRSWCHFLECFRIQDEDTPTCGLSGRKTGRRASDERSAPGYRHSLRRGAVSSKKTENLGMTSTP